MQNCSALTSVGTTVMLCAAFHTMDVLPWHCVFVKLVKSWCTQQGWVSFYEKLRRSNTFIVSVGQRHDHGNGGSGHAWDELEERLFPKADVCLLSSHGRE